MADDAARRHVAYAHSRPTRKEIVMCGKRARSEYHESYEGDTMRLAAGQAAHGKHCNWTAFPWWTLWLIWPAIGLVKWTAPLVAETYTTLMAASVPLLPVLLILLGLALIVRRRME
jgi:hypothetical protein